jgi:NADH dehydrogenase FAD-containing subunit
MKSAISANKRIVLLGAGHAHLYSLKRTHEFVQRGHEVTAVAPDIFWYSGLATGVIGGLYEPEMDQVDIAALVTHGGGRFVRDSVVGVDSVKRVIHLAAGPPLSYDVLSITLGSEPPAIAGADLHPERVYSVKPVRRLWELRQHLEQRFAAQPDVPLRVIIAGAGATGCEIAANIAQLATRRLRSISLTVLAGGEALLEQIPRAAARSIVAALERRGIAFRRNAQVSRIAENEVILSDGSLIPFEVFVNATGLRPVASLSEFGLPIDPHGGLIVDHCLRSVAAPEVHAAGDCVSLDGRPLPRVGVYAIRQAPVLFHNLMAAAEGKPPRVFRPQRRYLIIMNLGDETGLAVRGPWYWHGRAAFWLKDWIDRRFLREYQNAACTPQKR